MSATRRSWLTIGVAATLVLVVLATALAVTDRFTPRERGAIDALQPVADRPDDHIGVVVLVTSLSRNALSTHEELSGAVGGRPRRGRAPISVRAQFPGRVVW